MMNRRNFLKIIGIAGGVSIITYVAFPRFETIAGKIITRDLSGLTLERQAVSKFLADAQKNDFWRMFGWAQQKYIVLYYIMRSIRIPMPFMKKYKKYKAMIVEQFLLSTDFFYNKMDERKTIRYMAYYDPYQKSCAHPFSNLYYQNDPVII